MHTLLFKFLVFYLLIHVCIQGNAKKIASIKSIKSALSRPFNSQRNATPKPEFKTAYFVLPMEKTGESFICNPTLFSLKTSRYQREFRTLVTQFKVLLKKAIEQKKQLDPEFDGFQVILERHIENLKPFDFLSDSFLMTLLTLIPSSTKSMTFGFPTRQIQFKTEFDEARLSFRKMLQLSKEGKLKTPEGKALIKKSGVYAIRYQPIVDLATIKKKKGEFSTRRQPKEAKAWTTFHKMAKLLPEFQKYFFILDAFQILRKRCSKSPEFVSSSKQRFSISLSTTEDKSKLICPTKTEFNNLKQGLHIEMARQAWHLDGLLMKYYKDVHREYNAKENIIMTSGTLEPILSNTILEALKNLVPKKENDFLSYLDSLLPKLQHRNLLVEKFVRGFLQAKVKKTLKKKFKKKPYSRRYEGLSFTFGLDDKLIIDVDSIFDVNKAEEVMKKYEKFTTTDKGKAVYRWLFQVVKAFEARNEIQSPYIKSILYKRLEQVCHPDEPQSQVNSNTRKRRYPFSQRNDFTTNLPKKKRNENFEALEMSSV